MTKKSYIDFLKAVGAITIMIYHYRHLAYYDFRWPSGAALPLVGVFGGIYQYGYLAVELFSY